MKDNLGNDLKVGDSVYFCYNLWRGKDVLRKGKVYDLSGKMTVLINMEETEGCLKGTGHNTLVRVKNTKVGKIC